MVKKEKCVLEARKIEYLGHFISVEGVAIDPRKVKIIADWPAPKNINQLRSFLDLVGYYRRFVRG